MLAFLHCAGKPLFTLGRGYFYFYRGEKMIKELLFGRTPVPLLGKGLDALHQRQKAVATNIANANSPGFTRRVVDFESELRGALVKRRVSVERTHPDHLPGRNRLEGITPFLRPASDPKDGAGAEQVVVEREMADLAQTQLKYEAEAKLARSYFELLKMAIRGTS
jgi:flagellar basal-body rod protein FlgB